LTEDQRKTAKKTYAAITLLAVLIITISTSPVISSLTNSVTIANFGQISPDIYAASGSAVAIQAAVNQVAALGGGDVHIPAGTFNFVNVGEPWKTVVIPTGVNIVGAPNLRDSKGQNMGWSTVLVMPYEAPSGSIFFKYMMDVSRTDNKFRFTDIKVIGWRYFNQSSTTLYYGVYVENPVYYDNAVFGLKDFRIDHNWFQDCTESAIYMLGGHSGHTSTQSISGVIDHNILSNTYGYVGAYIADNTVRYGIGLGMTQTADASHPFIWEPNVADVFGHYTNMTVFIEDNYFSKWRHSVASNEGIHYVARHNTINQSYGYGEFDGHGSYATSIAPYQVGTRAMEVYSNIFINPDETWWETPIAVLQRGGAALIYNNVLNGYDNYNYIRNDVITYQPKCRTQQTYMWDNTLNGAVLNNQDPANIHLNVEYFLRAPNQAQDGFTYTPYQYPHPLTLG